MMSNAEINRYIHERIMGHTCKHTLLPVNDGVAECPLCGMKGRVDVPYEMQEFELWRVPDYCSDLNLIAGVEARVIDRLSLSVKNPKVTYCRHLMVANGFRYDDLGYLYEQVIRATAVQRARACVAAHQESEEDR